MTDTAGHGLDRAATSAASRTGWDAFAAEYQQEHGPVLGGADGVRFIWGPEQVDEADVRFLGPAGSLRGAAVLEVGSGAAQCGRWLARHEGAQVVSSDISGAQLRHAQALQAAHPVAPEVRLVQADADALPFADASFDLAFSSHGGLAFIEDLGPVFADLARILRPGGRVVASLPHPMRWVLPDGAAPEDLRVIRPYFDAEPYVERDEHGAAVYVEHHHTLEHLLSAVMAAGFVLDLVRELRWPEGNRHSWGGWTPDSGRLVPRTLVIGARVPA